MAEPGRLAVLGAGHAGPSIARLAIRAGYPVAIATSGDPEDIALITELVIPGAQPRWAADAVADADIVVLAMPLHRFLDVDPALLAGKLVIDAMNYWPASDGVVQAFEDGGSSEIVSRRLAGSAVVKALNHIGYHELAGQQPRIDGAETVQRYREHHDVRVRHRVGGPSRLRAGDYQLGDQRDVLRVARRGDGHRVPGLDGQPGDDRPEMTRAEHREPAALRHQNPTTWRTRTMWMRPGSSEWISRILPTELCCP